jgi:hypothetical protein
VVSAVEEGIREELVQARRCKVDGGHAIGKEASSLGRGENKARCCSRMSAPLLKKELESLAETLDEGDRDFVRTERGRRAGGGVGSSALVGVEVGSGPVRWCGAKRRGGGRRKRMMHSSV